MVLAVGDVERPVGIGHYAVGSGQTRQPPPRYTLRVVTRLFIGSAQGESRRHLELFPFNP